MILYYGDISLLKGMNWYTVELRSEKTVESTLRRLANAIPSTFGNDSVEIFVPLAERDLGVFDLSTSNYVFARSKSFSSLLRLKQITGIVGLMTAGDSNRPSQAILVSDDFVQGMILAAEEAFRLRPSDIAEGSFVRILDGETRDMCGEVTTINGSTACVTVQILTKQLVIETPIRNLMSLNHVPAELRVFYYSPLVAALPRTGDEAAILTDLTFAEEEPEEDDHLQAEQGGLLGRQQTTTALVKRLIFKGTIKPMELAREVVSALNAKTVKPPKTLAIIHGIIKARLVEDHFILYDPTLTNYREVVSRMGPEYRFTVEDIAAIDPNLSIPSYSEPSASTKSA
jgi:hypothetical protein